MSLVGFAQQFVFALLFGALIGVEREHHRTVFKKKWLPIVGLRTTMLFSVLGFLFAYAYTYFNNISFLILGGIIALIVSTTIYIANVIVNRYTGSTTYITILIVFFLGVLAGLGGPLNLTIGGTIALTLTLLLISKRRMVGWVRQLTDEEIFSALKFGIMAFIILPLLPNRFIDPWGIFNPQQIWYVVVAISLIYFISYVFMREFSSKGLLLSSFFGGLISSSPTAYQLADWVKKKKQLLLTAKPGIAIVCFTGQLSDLLVIGFVLGNLALLKAISLPYAFGMATLVVMSVLLYKNQKTKQALKLPSPFSLRSALKFGAIYVGLIFLSAVLKNYFGVYGLIPVVIAGSLISSSAVIASMASLSVGGSIELTIAAQMVILAAMISLLIKSFWVSQARNKELLRTTALITLSTAIIMVLALIVQQVIF